MIVIRFIVFCITSIGLIIFIPVVVREIVLGRYSWEMGVALLFTAWASIFSGIKVFGKKSGNQ